jgi:catechol 2,3-dioxygenase-like lactoylglutathione lyase family enzyme
MKPVIQSLDHLVLTVADVGATCAFYQRVLGFEVVTFRGDRQALTFGSQKINLHEVGNEFDPKAGYPTPGSGDFCFLTETPIGDIQRHVESCGVTVLMGPTHRTGATGPILSIYFRDPDGNLIEVANRND